MRIIKTVKGKKYLTFREYNPDTKEQSDTSCGQEGMLESENKYAILEQEFLRKKIKQSQEKLHELTNNYSAIKIKNTKLPTNKIINGDVLDTMKKFPSNSVHMAITSPPYNVGLDYDKYKDQKSYDEYMDWLETVFRELYRVLVKGGRFALNIAPTGISDFKPIHNDISQRLRDMGFIFRTEILWYKQNIYKRTAWGSWKNPSNPHIMPSWEYVLIYCKDVMKLEGDKKNIDVTSEEFKKFSDGFWHIQPETKRNGHPAPFPEDLIYRLIKYYTYKNNIILDMFGGTGTVALTSWKNKRKFIHIDSSKEYCDIVKYRIEQHNEKIGKQSKIDIFTDDHLLYPEKPLVTSGRRQRGNIKASIKKSKSR